MIGKISESIVKHWVKKDIIKSDDYELYHYGWFVVLSDLWFFAFCLIFGVIFKIALPSIVFFVSFFIVRRFAGGFHAKTELHCQILSLSFLFCSIVAIKCLYKYIDDVSLIIIDLLCIVMLFLFSPSSTPQKPLTSSERKKFKMITFYLSVTFFTTICILLHFNARLCATAIVCAFFLENILVILGRRFNHRLTEE